MNDYSVRALSKTMITIRSTIACVAILSVHLMAHAKGDEEGAWVNLLNEDSLELWEPGPSKAKKPRTEIGDRWSLKHGVLHLDRDAETGTGGQIWTKKKYRDFDLKFEFNIAHDGNSGIKYRGVNIEGRAIGCEYQIIDDENYRDNKNPTHRTACLYELVAVPVDRKWNPAGQWNTGRIRVSNNLIEHWLNGKKVVSIEFGSDDWKARFKKSKYKIHPEFAKNAGPIVLTDHQDTVSYRNLMIRDLGAQPEKVRKSSTRTATAKAIPEPLAFSTNCKACHMLDQALVGPSLVELSELYPRRNLADFIRWTVTPGRKRDHMPQMPSMAHVSEPQLVEIYEYIKKVTVGVRKVKTSKVDPYATAPAKTRRPRIERTFVPEASPASLILALPTPGKHNVIWDTAQCRLRYISIGEPDNYPYLRSNGNALAKVGEIIYRETDPILSTERIQYTGYHLSKEGYPSFVYQIGEVEVTETISVEEGSIIRRIDGEPNLPSYELPNGVSDYLKIEATHSGNTITVAYSAK